MEDAERRDIYESFAMEVPFGVLLLDTGRTVICWNRRAEQSTGFLRHEVIEHACSELATFGCEGRERRACESQDCPLRSMVRHIRVSAPRFEMQHKAGHSVPVVITLLHLPDEGGNSGAAIIF